jgi:GNAT superfamily N-acetyltransferase
MIKKMTFDHIPEIQRIDKICFKADAQRRADGIKAYIEKSSNASIVYELHNKVVGYNFIHVWGNFGWFGSFGVDPLYQGSGIGKELLQHTINFLKEDIKVQNIGLCTMPESSYNVGIYMNMGFKPLKLSLNMKKQLDFSRNDSCSPKYEVTTVDVSSESNYLKLKEDIKTLSNKISKGLDLSSQLYLIKYKGFGTAFVLKDNNEIKGFALCHSKSTRENPTDCLEITLLCISGDIEYKEALDSILHQCVKYAKSINCKSIAIDCTTYNYDICTHLLCNHKFKIKQTRLILIMGNENYINEYNGLVLCRWGG